MTNSQKIANYQEAINEVGTFEESTNLFKTWITELKDLFNNAGIVNKEIARLEKKYPILKEMV